MKKQFLNLLFNIVIFLFINVSYSQIGIGTKTPNTASILDLTSTNRGFLPPRLTTIQRDNIPNKVPGLMIYNTNENCMQYWNNNRWIGECSSGGINTLTCAGITHTGVLNNGINTSASTSIPYTGGTVGMYNAQVIASSGVTGLSAVLSAGVFNSGNGLLTLNITGTPNATGNATFTFNIDGKSCTFTRAVGPTPTVVRIGYFGTYSFGSTELPAFNSQLNNSANYGITGTYSGVSNFSFTNINSTLGNTAGNILKSNYDIINVGYATLTANQVTNIVSFANEGGVVIVNAERNTHTNVAQAFSITGSIGDGGTASSSRSNISNTFSNIFGNTRDISLTGVDTSGRILASQLPNGSTIYAAETAIGGTASVFTLGGIYGGKVIFVWDEGIFRHTDVSGTAIDTPQERFIHNLMAYAIDKARGL